MTIKPLTILLTGTTLLSFILSYAYGLTIDNITQFLAVAVVIMTDGFFGIIAGIKREGFKTFKAFKILKTLGVWWIILGTILAIENGFIGAGWMSETIMIPFLLFEIISILKNASMAGFIKIDLVNVILNKIDNHKGIR